MSLMGIDEVIILCIELDEALGLGQLVRKRHAETHAIVD
jgi:hypothetical protein